MFNKHHYKLWIWLTFVYKHQALEFHSRIAFAVDAVKIGACKAFGQLCASQISKTSQTQYT